MKKTRSFRIAMGIVLAALLAASTAACKPQQPISVGGETVTTTVTTPPQTTEPVGDMEVIDITTTTTEPTQPPTYDREKEKFEWVKDLIPEVVDGSAKRLFSISMGGGFGTREETAFTTWTVYADGTVDRSKLDRRTPAAKLSENDYETLLSMVTREKVKSLTAEENRRVTDGESTYLCLYDDQGELLVYKGGYSVDAGEYSQLFWDVYRMVAPYCPE